MKMESLSIYFENFQEEVRKETKTRIPKVEKLVKD